MKIIKHSSDCPIKPCDIDTSRHFFEAFGKSETETSAMVCVKLAQKNGGWEPFTKKEIDDFWKEDVWFNGLTNKFIQEIDGKYHYTVEFVSRCYTSSPNSGPL